MAVDRHGARRGLVQPQDHPDCGGFACTVRAKKASDYSSPDRERQAVYGELAAVALGQLMCFDHVLTLGIAGAGAGEPEGPILATQACDLRMYRLHLRSHTGT
jgi:hypothetical protein